MACDTGAREACGRSLALLEHVVPVAYLWCARLLAPGAFTPDSFLTALLQPETVEGQLVLSAIRKAGLAVAVVVLNSASMVQTLFPSRMFSDCTPSENRCGPHYDSTT